MGLWKTISNTAYAAGVLWTSTTSLRVLYSAYSQLAMPFDFEKALETQPKSVGVWSTVFTLRVGLPDNLALDSTIANLAFKVLIGVDVTTSGTATWQIRLSDNADATAVNITDDGYYQISYTWPAASASAVKGVYLIPVQAKSSTGGLGDNLTMARTYGVNGLDCFAGCILT